MIYYFYKIVCDDLPEHVYIGSTMAYANRKYQHKSDCYNENRKTYNLKIYQTIRANGGWDNWRMVCIHQEDVVNKREAEKIEESYRLELNGNMNERRSFRSPEQKKEQKKEWYKNNPEYNKQYIQDNKDSIAEKKKEYREQNKNHIAEQKKEYAEKNKEKISQQKKEYREQNKVKISEQKKEYYENNKEIITCECGCFIRKDGLKDHHKTNKHIKLMGL